MPFFGAPPPLFVNVPSGENPPPTSLANTCIFEKEIYQCSCTENHS